MKNIVMSEKDNVATMIEDLPAQTVLVYQVNGLSKQITSLQGVPFGHKIAIQPIQPSEPILKYGEVIGTATRLIQAGEHVHVHNIEGIRGRGDKAGGEKDENN